jgi:hypothetical protein
MAILIDAVQAILRGSMPIVFVTAFRTAADRRAPEPTYLVTKPFDPDTLRVTIGRPCPPARPALAGGDSGRGHAGSAHETGHLRSRDHAVNAAVRSAARGAGIAWIGVSQLNCALATDSGHLWRMVDPVPANGGPVHSHPSPRAWSPSCWRSMPIASSPSRHTTRAPIRRLCGFQEQLLTGVRHTLRSFAVSYAAFPATECGAPRGGASPYPQFTDVFKAGGADLRQRGGGDRQQRRCPTVVSPDGKPGFVVGDYMGGG